MRRATLPRLLAALDSLTQCADRGGPLLLTRLAQQASIGLATRTTASLGMLSAAWYALFVPEILRKRSE